MGRISGEGNRFQTSRSDFVSKVIYSVGDENALLKFECDPCTMQQCQLLANMFNVFLRRLSEDDWVSEIVQEKSPFYGCQDYFHCSLKLSGGFFKPNGMGTKQKRIW